MLMGDFVVSHEYLLHSVRATGELSEIVNLLECWANRTLRYLKISIGNSTSTNGDRRVTAEIRDQSRSVGSGSDH